MDNTERFSGRAKDYTVGRPAYAEAFIDNLYTEQGFSENSVIADIGSGTGKFAKHLLDRGSTVICVEPNEDMRHTAEKELGAYERFKSVDGTADGTTLAAGSVDFITTAQAFHWFDAAEFQRECGRILRPGGKVLLIWNMRDMSASFNKECYDVFAKYCPRFKGFSGGIKEHDDKIKYFFHDLYQCVRFDNPLLYDKNRFISRSLSGSYSLKQGDADYEKYLEELTKLFDKYSVNHMLEIQNQTVAYIGSVARTQ